MEKFEIEEKIVATVSYTHLDVYKRQVLFGAPAWTYEQSGVPNP